MLADTEAQTVLPLYEKGHLNGKTNLLKDEYFLSDRGLPLVKNIAIPDITIYLPGTKWTKTPAVIIFPGGGYGVIAYKHEGHDVAAELNKLGIAAMVVKYRLPAESEIKPSKFVPLQDAQQAIAIVRRNATAWNLDLDKIGLMGFSAGGHLAATAGTHYADRKILDSAANLRPDFMVLIYPVISFSNIGHAGSRENLLGRDAAASDIEYFSNELHVTPQTPPTFLVHAADDNGVPIENSTRFKKELDKKGVKNQLFRYSKGGHGFGLINKAEAGMPWLTEVVNWIKNL